MAEWIDALRATCERDSQAAVARRLDVSASTVSQVLSGRYRAATDAIEAKVRGVIMAETVDCPVLGDGLGRDRCRELQRLKPGPTADPVQRMLMTACRTCRHADGAKGGNDDL